MSIATGNCEKFKASEKFQKFYEILKQCLERFGKKIGDFSEFFFNFSFDSCLSQLSFSYGEKI